jgi:hypothetical protein
MMAASPGGLPLTPLLPSFLATTSPFLGRPRPLFSISGMELFRFIHRLDSVAQKSVKVNYYGTDIAWLTSVQILDRYQRLDIRAF